MLQEKLSRPIEQISDKFALEAAALGAKSLGIGLPAPEVRVSSSDHLASLAHRLLDLQGKRPVEVVEVVAKPSGV